MRAKSSGHSMAMNRPIVLLLFIDWNKRMKKMWILMLYSFLISIASQIHVKTSACLTRNSKLEQNFNLLFNGTTVNGVRCTRHRRQRKRRKYRHINYTKYNGMRASERRRQSYGKFSHAQKHPSPINDSHARQYIPHWCNSHTHRITLTLWGTSAMTVLVGACVR